MAIRIQLFILAVLFLAVPFACVRNISVTPAPPSPKPVATPTATPAFTCSTVPAPGNACPDPYFTPLPFSTPCSSAPITLGTARVDICSFSNNAVTKTLLIQHMTLPAGWQSQVSVTPNQITSFGIPVTIQLTGSLVGIWDVTDSFGNQVPSGCYAVHWLYTDASGNTTELFIPITVNRPLGKVMVDVFDSNNKPVRALYNLVANPGPSTSISGMNLSTGSFQPSYCGTGPPPTQLAIACSNGTNLVWDGRNDQGTILPAGTYTIKLCASDDVNVTNLSGTVSTTPLAEASAATTVYASPNPLTAGTSTIVYANPCGGSGLTLTVSLYDSGNNLMIAPVTGTAGSNQTAVSTSGLTAGTYQAHVDVYDMVGFTGTVIFPLILN